MGKGKVVELWHQAGPRSNYDSSGHVTISVASEN